MTDTSFWQISACRNTFNLAKNAILLQERQNTLVIKFNYEAPEIIKSAGHTKTVDWWTLGILIYEMLTGIVPFYSKNQNIMFNSIIEKEVSFKN